MYKVLSKEELTCALQQANYSVILLDESIRERPKVEQFYVVSAVQPRFDSKSGRSEQLEELRSGLVALAEDVFGRPYWHTVEAWQIDGGKTAEKMCELIAASCDVRMSIASIGLGKKKFSAEEYKQARGKAIKNAVSALQAPSALIVLDRVRSYGRNRRDDVGVMEGDVRTVAPLRRDKSVVAVHASTRVVHTSQSSDPVLWAADLAASAASRSLLGDFRLLDALSGQGSGARLVVAADVPARRVFQGLWQEHVQATKVADVPAPDHASPRPSSRQVEVVVNDAAARETIRKIEETMRQVRRRRKQAAVEESSSAHALRPRGGGRSGPLISL